MGKGWKKYNYDHRGFGKLIRKYRQALRWSFTDLSWLTGINKGTLQQVEEKERSLPVGNRRKLVDVLVRELKGANIRINHRELQEMAGLETEYSSGAQLLKLHNFSLEQASSEITQLQYELYQGKARSVLEKASQLYGDLKKKNISEKDMSIALVQIRVGILLGQAQEAFHPWYQRCNIAIRTYNDVQIRIFERFPLFSFRFDYAKLHSLRAALYREQGNFEKSLPEFRNGLFYAEQVDSPFLQAALRHNYAHVKAVQGDERAWQRELEETHRSFSYAEGEVREHLFGLLEDTRAQGYKRLAYNHRKNLSMRERQIYAQRGLECFEEAQAHYPNSWSPETISVDGHPLIAMLSRAQCLVWIDPHAALGLLNSLRGEATILFPALLAKINYTEECAKQVLAWHRNDPPLVFNLDTKYTKMKYS